MGIIGNELLWAAFKAFVVAVVLTPIVRDVFRSYNIVDRPGERKVHAHPIPRIGGIPIAIAYAVAFAGFDTSAGNGQNLPIASILPGALIVFLTGLIDDFLNLRPMVKMLGQVVAAIAVYSLGVRVESLGGYDLGIWLSLPATIFWLVLTTNAFNLIDGLDGLCSGVGLVATLALFGAGVMHGNVGLLQAVVPLSGALVGFLAHNSNPATVFLGDSGALLIGFLLGCYGMVWSQKTAALAAMMVPLMALSIPLLDVGLSVIRRSIKRKPIFGADRGHIHHRLLDRGLTPRRAVMVLYLVAATAGGFAVLLSAPQTDGYEMLVLLAALGVLLYGIRQLRYAEFAALRSALFGGDLQRDLAGLVQLETMEQQLLKTKSPQQWWTQLQSSLQEIGCVRVAWIRPQHSPQQRFDAELREGPIEWTLDVHTAGGEKVELAGPESLRETIDARTLRDVLRRSLRHHHKAWASLGNGMGSGLGRGQVR
jgi:UDP-GlcNAc:undecaprenyl-phosphate/decaprenyl-phosphate GlcNAc-1-phosphate transferase